MTQTVGRIEQLTHENPSLPDLARTSPSRADFLLAALMSAKHPNCTLYLIWHYLERGDVDAAHAEYCRDSDKLGNHRKTVESVLAANKGIVIVKKQQDGE